MFLHVCVILFTGGVSGQGDPPDQADTPLRQGRPPPRTRQTPPGPGRHPFRTQADTPPDQADPPRPLLPRKKTVAYGQ